MLVSKGATASWNALVTTAVIGMAEVARPLRFVNVFFGAWLVLAPWFLDGASPIAHWTNLPVGIALIALSLPRSTRSTIALAGIGSWSDDK